MCTQHELWKVKYLFSCSICEASGEGKRRQDNWKTVCTKTTSSKLSRYDALRYLEWNGQNEGGEGNRKKVSDDKIKIFIVFLPFPFLSTLHSDSRFPHTHTHLYRTSSYILLIAEMLAVFYCQNISFRRIEMWMWAEAKEKKQCREKYRISSWDWIWTHNVFVIVEEDEKFAG